MSNTDYNGNGFNQGGDGAVFGDPGSDPGSVSDYDTWDWKQIMAAINGMSAGVDNSDNTSHAQSVSDPTSLQTAADAFYSVQQTLAQIAQSLSDQANALAGPNGPWTGDAADSFIDMMNTFSKQVNATANVLSGGATGTDSVPQQLADNSVNLLNAQNKIVEIDNWYANQAIEMGVQPMSNGLIPISQKPQLVDMMTSDMRAVLKSLAGEYQVTIDTVRSPDPITSPGDNNPNDTNDPNDPADMDGDPADEMPVSAMTSGLPSDDALESTPAPFPSDLSTAGAGGLPDGALDPGALDAALNPGGALADPAAFPGGTDVGGADDPAAFPGGTGVGDSALDPLDSGDPAAFPGGTGVGGGLPIGTEDALADPLDDADAGDSFPGGLGTGGLGGLPGDADGLGDTDGLGGAESGKAAAFPGGLSTESALPDGLDSGVPGAGALGTGDEDASGDGMPYMPGMGGAAGQTADPAERSDASGLLDGDVAPWDGSADVGDDVGSPLGAAPGSGRLDGLAAPDAEDAEPAAGAALSAAEPAADDGMPYLPGTGGGAGRSGGADGERSDASGLLEGDADPWQGEPDVAEEVGSAVGTAAGAAALDLLAAGAVSAAAHEAQHEAQHERHPAEYLVEAEPIAWAHLPESVEARPASAATEETAATEGTEGTEVVLLEAEEAVAVADDRVALVGQAEGEGTEESAAAWDAAGDSLIPLLWGLVNGEEERDVLSSGYATAEEGTWTGQPGSPVVDPAGDPDDPGWATWRPNRAPSPGGLTERAMAATSALSASCSADASDEVLEMEEPEEPEEPAPSRSIADLLVQDGDTWGSTGREDSDALL